MKKKMKNPRSSRGHKSRRGSKQQQLSSNTDLPHLPSDVCWDIFVLLPAKSLIRFRAVCKAWRSIIDDPYFVKAHIDKQQLCAILFCTPTGPSFYSVDPDALKNSTNGRQTILAAISDLPTHVRGLPVATCHGLIFHSGEIWNPLIGDRLMLPRGDLFYYNPRKVVLGLGYDYATDDYKAVVVDSTVQGQTLTFPTYVYSLRSNSWRRIMNCPYGGFRQDLGGPGVFLSGALHWVTMNYEIIELDLETEIFRKLQQPPFWKSGLEVMVGKRDLAVLDGCLVVTNYRMNDYYEVNFDALVLKGGSWIKLFSLRHYGYANICCRSLRAVAYVKNKTQILLQDEYNFYLVDAMRDSMKMVSIRGRLTGKFISAQLFQETLFQPKDICGVGGQRKKKILSRESKRSNIRMEKPNTDQLYFSESDLDIED